MHHYLLTALPDLPEEVSIDNKVDYTVDGILTFIKENAGTAVDPMLFYIFLLKI